MFSSIVIDHYNTNKAVSYTHLDVYKRQIFVFSLSFLVVSFTYFFATGRIKNKDNAEKTMNNNICNIIPCGKNKENKKATTAPIINHRLHKDLSLIHI